MQTFLIYFAICLVMGIGTETLAYALKLWLYREPWMRILNIVLTFGLIFGGMSWLLAGHGVLAQFAAGAGFGLAYEIANDRWLKAWSFPGGTLPWLTGQPAVIGVGLTWGFVPVMAVVLARGTRMSTRGADRLHAVLMVLAALGTVAYWVTYFTSGATHVRTDEVYLAFENAFPLADGWMVACYLLSAYFLWLNDRRAVLWGIAAGSAMIFLGCMDFLFNLEQGHFRAPISAEMWAEIIIVVFCLAFGPFTIWRLWTHPLARV